MADNGGAIRLHNVVKRLNGSSGEDGAVWFRQVKLVAKLQGIEDLATVMPLFLDDAAFAVYEQLEEDDQGNPVKSKRHSLRLLAHCKRMMSFI